MDVIDAANPATETRARRERGKRRDPSAKPLGVPFIVRNIPPYNILEEEGLVRVERTAERILAEIGIEFRDDPVAIETAALDRPNVRRKLHFAARIDVRQAASQESCNFIGRREMCFRRLLMQLANNRAQPVGTLRDHVGDRQAGVVTNGRPRVASLLAVQLA